MIELDAAPAVPYSSLRECVVRIRTYDPVAGSFGLRAEHA